VGPRLPVGARGWRWVAVNARKGGFDDNAKPRASPSVMKQMIASWSMVMVHALMVAGPGLEPNIARSWARESDDPRRASWGLGAM